MLKLEENVKNSSYTNNYRNDIIGEWIHELRDNLQWHLLIEIRESVFYFQNAKYTVKLNCTAAKNFSLTTILGDPVIIKDWTNVFKLPKDDFSVSNGIMIQKSIKFPLFVDPQGQANKFIKNMHAKDELTICKLTTLNLQRILENAIQFGKPLLIENVGEIVDSMLFPILSKNTITSGNRKMIKLGDSTVDYDENFKLYLTSKLETPHYTPIISTKVILINFAITEVKESRKLNQLKIF